MSIQEIRLKIKRFLFEYSKDLIISFIIILTAVGGYCIGYYSKITKNSTDPVLIKIENGALLNNKIEINQTNTYKDALNIQNEKSEGFVASKNGTKYYPINCGSASRINEENKIYFTTSIEAENAGYTRTVSCK